MSESNKFFSGYEFSDRGRYVLASSKNLDRLFVRPPRFVITSISFTEKLMVVGIFGLSKITASSSSISTPSSKVSWNSSSSLLSFNTGNSSITSESATLPSSHSFAPTPVVFSG
ncbi:hypothetical protein PsorP6_015621 [Peronosclerospora sorghi]|uniref:Uncharacterized protein n=1 Tax=Peronosclerospora sorghi TaxID=230839 RepID=A0ACC0WPP5_9STRA|nr:hypothetical protein PsorP6_015621 [Peronosclerospora sorghi]